VKEFILSGEGLLQKERFILSLSRNTLKYKDIRRCE